MCAIDEGLIKFECDWRPGAGPDPSAIAEIGRWRARCFEMGWVGVTPEGISFGNLSTRIGDTCCFWVTGTGTGCLAKLSPLHYARVVASDSERNHLACVGPVRASSESMTHAVIYASLPTARAVIHIHCAKLWRSCVHRIPTTPDDIPYGTPEMCRAIATLAPEANGGIIAMGGHQDGLIAFGTTADEAGERLIELTTAI
jgi:hypothetical protein